MASVYKVNATGAAAISVANGATLVVPAGRTYKLISVSCKFSAAPTTSENFVVTLDANPGAAYDVVLYSVNPSVGATTSLIWFPDEPLLLEGGDSIDVTFTNTDTVTYGLQITAEAV